MNAVVIKAYEFDERELMPINEKDDLQVQVARLETNVQHIQSDVSDMKIDLRATNQRIDTLSEKMDTRFDTAKEEMNKRFDKSDSRMDKADARMDRIEEKLNGILVRLESCKAGALGLYAALAAALLGVMAKGFKWF